MSTANHWNEKRREISAKKGRGALQVSPDGRRAHSYGTCLLDVLPDGRTIGNDTKYSATTSHHQSKVGVRACDVVVTDVPQGTSDLAAWYQARTL